MLKIVLVAATLAVALAVPQYPDSVGSSGSGYGAPGRGSGKDGNIGFRATGPIESDPNLQLENEGANLPSDIVDQQLLDRVVDALSEELAQQEAARRAASGAYGAPVAGYGPPSSGYGAPLGAGGNGAGNGVAGPGSSNGRISLLIPPDPLKAKLIANYIQRGAAPYTGSANNGGYDGANSGNRGGYSG